MTRAIKRLIIRVHLYLGVALSALFMVWFASGIVMMYQGYPGLTTAERFAAIPVLDCGQCRVFPGVAITIAGQSSPATPLRLGMLHDRPVWRVATPQGQWRAVFADTQAVVPPLMPTASAEVARAFLGVNPGAVRWHSTLRDADQWTLTRTVRDQLPLHRIDVDDADGTRVYVSPAAAEVVSMSTRRERLLAWFGAIPHWIYPTLLRRHTNAWAWLVIAVSGLGTLMCVAGLAVGGWQLRWRRRNRPDGSMTPRTPYRDRMMRWHHWLGFGIGTFACTWVFSGLMSMNPGDWSPGSSPSSAQRRVWSGGDIAPTSVTVSPAIAWQSLRQAGRAPRELQVVRLAGEHFWVGYDTPTRTARVSAYRADTDRVESAASPVDSAWPVDALIARARVLFGDARLEGATLLTEYDDYYRDPERQRPLPIMRLIFDDPERTWLYIDPRTGEIAARYVTRSRLERWLYAGLHDFDFAWLAYRRPLWDVVVILLSLGGMLLSATGVVLTWRYARSLGTGQRHLRRR